MFSLVRANLTETVRSLTPYLIQGFKRDAKVRVFIPKEMLKGMIWTLYFEIDQPGFNGSPFGEEVGGWLREEKRSSWAVPIGVFTKGRFRTAARTAFNLKWNTVCLFEIKG